MLKQDKVSEVDLCVERDTLFCSLTHQTKRSADSWNTHTQAVFHFIEKNSKELHNNLKGQQRISFCSSVSCMHLYQ